MTAEFIEMNEVFGPTIQGEGTAAGRHCMFIRTYGCNLRCTWCDTAKTWAVTPELASLTTSGKLYDKDEQMQLLSPDEVIALLMTKWDVQMKPTTIIISGGEPMMQAKKLYPLARKLFDWGNKIHIETAGTIKPIPELDNCIEQYNVSPKLAHSGNIHKKRYKSDALSALRNTGKAKFKFVMQDIGDFPEVDFIVSDVEIPRQDVMVMPEGRDPETNMLTSRLIIDGALDRGYGLSFRSHILIWGDKEGV